MGPNCLGMNVNRGCVLHRPLLSQYSHYINGIRNPGVQSESWVNVGIHSAVHNRWPPTQLYVPSCIRKRKTCLNISIPNLLRHHKMNTSDLWPLPWQEVLKVVVLGFQTLMCMANYCWGNVSHLNTCCWKDGTTAHSVSTCIEAFTQIQFLRKFFFSWGVSSLFFGWLYKCKLMYWWIYS